MDQLTDTERLENCRTLIIGIAQWLHDIGYPYDFATPNNLPPAPLRPLIETLWASEETAEYFAAAAQTCAEEGGWLTDDWSAPPVFDA